MTYIGKFVCVKEENGAVILTSVVVTLRQPIHITCRTITQTHNFVGPEYSRLVVVL